MFVLFVNMVKLIKKEKLITINFIKTAYYKLDAVFSFIKLKKLETELSVC